MPVPSKLPVPSKEHNLSIKITEIMMGRETFLDQTAVLT